MRRVVLVTRPEPGLTDTMRAVAALGYAPLAAPMLRIEPLFPVIPRRVQAVLFTSGQAVAPLAALAPWLIPAPVLAVGDATAARARSAGFARVDSADGDAAQLACLAAATLSPSDGPVLLACGRGQGKALASRLRRDGFRVSIRCVYRSVPAAELPREAIDALDGDAVLAVLLFSAETARVFGTLLPVRLQQKLGSVRALAISRNTADMLRAMAWQHVSIADAPNAGAMLSLLQPAAPLREETGPDR